MGSAKIISLMLLVIVLYFLSWAIIFAVPIYYIYKVQEDKRIKKAFTYKRKQR